jgi:CDGSH-type Zn-finger protein
MTDRAGPAVRIVRNGPMIVDGGVPLSRLVRDVSGWTLAPMPAEPGETYSLCRCGSSSVLPFCDRDEPYGCFEEEASTGAAPAPFRWEVPDGSDAALALKPHGPARLAGSVPVVEAATGSVVDPGERVSLCRCGASRCQPLCDGSHKVVGFREPR